MSRAISEILYVANSSQAVKATNDYARAQDNLSTKNNKFVASANTGRIAQMNFSRVVQDAPFGFVAIQNNIDPLVHSFQQLRAETGSNRAAFKAFLASFAGPAGMLATINIAVSLFTAFTLATRKNKNSVDEWSLSLKNLAGKADKFKEDLRSLRQEIEKLTKEELDDYFGRINKELIKTNENLATTLNRGAFASFGSFAGAGAGLYEMIFGDANKIDEATKKIIAQNTAIKKIEELRETPGIIQALENEIESLDKKLGAAKSETAIAKLNSEIEKLRKELERLQGLNLNNLRDMQIGDLAPRGVQTLKNRFVMAESERVKARNKSIVEGTYTPQGVQFQSGLIPEQKQAKEMFQAYLQEGTKFRTTFATAFSQTLTQYGSLAFDRMFGHANNLLSIFAKSLFSQVIGGFSSYLTGGFFSAIGLPVPGVGGRPISINIDGTVVAEYVDGRVRQKQERFQRRTV